MGGRNARFSSQTAPSAKTTIFTLWRNFPDFCALGNFGECELLHAGAKIPSCFPHTASAAQKNLPKPGATRPLFPQAVHAEGANFLMLGRNFSDFCAGGACGAEELPQDGAKLHRLFAQTAHAAQTTFFMMGRDPPAFS